MAARRGRGLRSAITGPRRAARALARLARLPPADLRLGAVAAWRFSGARVRRLAARGWDARPDRPCSGRVKSRLRHQRNSRRSAPADQAQAAPGPASAIALIASKPTSQLNSAGDAPSPPRRPSRRRSERTASTKASARRDQHHADRRAAQHRAPHGRSADRASSRYGYDQPDRAKRQPTGRPNSAQQQVGGPGARGRPASCCGRPARGGVQRGIAARMIESAERRSAPASRR